MTADGGPAAAPEDPRPDRPHKSERAFRTIGEVSDSLEVPQHVLRFWETKFTAIKPLKRGGRRRYYRPEDVSLLQGVRNLLYVDGYTIRGVQKLLREGGVDALRDRARGAPEEPAAEADAPAAREDGGEDPRRAELRGVLRELEELRRILDEAV